MQVVFDIDGVLMDTKQAVFEAYKRAGVLMPPEAWGKPWNEWLPRRVNPFRAEEIHKAKNDIYPTLLSEYSKPLSGSVLAREYIDQNVEVKFITGSSLVAAEVVLKTLDLPIDRLVGYQLSTEQKARELRLLQDENSETVAIDDLDNLSFFCWLMRMPLITYYAKESSEELKRRIEWRLSVLKKSEDV